LEIIETKDLLRELSQIKNDIDELYNTLNIDDKKNQLSLLIEETFKDNFWQDQTHSTQVQQQITQFKRTIEPWVSLKKEVEDSIVLLEMAIDEQDNDVIKDIGNKVEQFRNRFGQL